MAKRERGADRGAEISRALEAFRERVSQIDAKAAEARAVAYWSPEIGRRDEARARKAAEAEARAAGAEFARAVSDGVAHALGILDKAMSKGVDRDLYPALASAYDACRAASAARVALSGAAQAADAVALAQEAAEADEAARAAVASACGAVRGNCAATSELRAACVRAIIDGTARGGAGVHRTSDREALAAEAEARADALGVPPAPDLRDRARRMRRDLADLEAKARKAAADLDPNAAPTTRRVIGAVPAAGWASLIAGVEEAAGPWA